MLPYFLDEGMRYPVVYPVEDDDAPMLGQLCVLLLDEVPDDDVLVESLDVVVVVVAANDAKPTVRMVATAKTARTAMRSSARLLGNDRMLGEGMVVLNSIFSLSPPGEVPYP
jgi:hypothetical protein